MDDQGMGPSIEGRMNDQMLDKLRNLAEQAKRIQEFLATGVWAGPWSGNIATVVISEITELRKQAQETTILRQKVQQLEQRLTITNLNNIK